MGTRYPGQIDEIDRQILSILSENPRLPYADIADKLAQEGFEMSDEGVRQRVTSLLEVTTGFFLLRPEEHTWEIVLTTIRTHDYAGAKGEAFEAMAEMNFWFVGNGFGTIDLYGIATVNINADVKQLLEELRGLESVKSVDYFIETDRFVSIQDYLPVDGS